MRGNFVYMPRNGHCLFTCLLHILICLIYLQSFEKVTINTREIFLIPKQNSYDCNILNSEFITNNVQIYKDGYFCKRVYYWVCNTLVNHKRICTEIPLSAFPPLFFFLLQTCIQYSFGLTQ